MALTGWARRRDPVRWILGAMIAVWSAVFIWLGWLRHARFTTYGYDLGIFDQATWLLSRFTDPFITVRGLDFFGHHMNLIFFLFVPFYWVGAGPEFLLIVQVAAQGAGAVALFLLARDRLADRWLALVLAAVLLLNPSYQYLAWEYFHPEAFAIGPLLFAYWAARAERWRWFAVAAVLAVACKEDVALAVAGLGLLIWVRGHRRIGVATFVGALGWFLLSTRVLMRWALGGAAPFYDQYFSELGDDAGSVVGTTLTKPGKVWRIVTRPDRMNYYLNMLVPFAFLPLAEPLTLLLLAGPALAVNALTSTVYARGLEYHYTALVVAGLAVATVEAVAYLGRTRSARRFLVGLLAAVSLAASVAWGPSPISVRYKSGIWPLDANPSVALKGQAIAAVPGDASVSATYNLITHLTHRRDAYQFPEPWRAEAWGINGEGLPDPQEVEWIAADRSVLAQADGDLLDRLLANEFSLVYSRGDLVVARRQ